MDILTFILLMVVAGVVTAYSCRLLADFVSSKIRVCDIDFMNTYYFEINFDFIIGGVLYSLPIIHYLSDQPFWVGIVLAFGCNSIPLVFGKMKDYETLRKNLPLLDIDDNESFEEFVETHIEKDDDENE